MGLQERTCTMLLLSFLLFYATKWVELITLFHDFYHVVPIKLMTMHYSILYVLLDSSKYAQRYMLCTRYIEVFLFIANEGILSRHDRHEEKKTTRSFTTVWHVNFHLVTIDLCWEIILLDVSTRLFCYSQAAAVW